MSTNHHSDFSDEDLHRHAVGADGHAQDGDLAESDEPTGDERNHGPSGMPGWFISFGVHALLALVLFLAVVATHQLETELPPIRMTVMDPPKQEKKDPIREVETKVQLNVVENDTVAPINPIVTPEEEKVTSDDNETDSQKGRADAVSTVETGSTGAFMAIGASSGGSGMIGTRFGGKKRAALHNGGGNPASEAAVDRALMWFKKHQSPNGMWDTERYPVNCQENPKCEPGSTASSGGSDANVAMTGYALLCFLGAGYDHQNPSRFKATVQKGLDWLRSVQKADGLLGSRNYENAVATMALAEAYAMSSDQTLKAPAQKGVNVILARQVKDAKAADQAYSGLGWSYVDPDAGRIDSSVTGWNVMALKSALAGGLNVGTGMEGSKKWLDRAWKATNPGAAALNDPYNAMTGFPYTYNATNEQVEVGAPGAASKDMAPVGALCAVFLGHHAGDIMLESLCNHIMKYQMPTAYPCNTYYLYYNTLAVYQAGGERWKKWNNSVRDLLTHAQRRDDGCFDGSWDFANTVFPGADHGRILSTAYCCLCLEVYYRYEQIGAADRAARAAAQVH